MTKQFLNLVVKASLTGDNLDPGKVSSIAPHLSRKELKMYLRSLKNFARHHTITITSTRDISLSLQNDFKNKFVGKNLNFEIDPEILFGIRVTDEDMVYDNTLKSTFNKIVAYVKE